MREYWEAGAEAREALLIPGTFEWGFAEMTDSVYHEWDALTEPRQTAP